MPLAVFKRGSKGPFVAEIQKQLNVFAGYGLSLMGNGSSLHAPLVEDGAYGRKTAERVREFQQWNPPLKIDGKVGPNTWGKMTGKMWSPEVAKAAQEAAPVVADKTEVSPENWVFRPEADAKPGYLYVLAEKDFAKARRSGNLPHRSSHPKEMCHYSFVHNTMSGPIDMLDTLITNNILIKELILCGHSGGAGVLTFGDKPLAFHGMSASYFREIMPFLLPGAIIWIFGCSFASSRNNVFDWDHNMAFPEEMLPTPSGGITAMIDIAKYTKREVRAGFTYQTSNFDGFTKEWCAAYPDGSFKIHYMGRKLTPREAIQLALERGGTCALWPVIYGMWGYKAISDMFKRAA